MDGSLTPIMRVALSMSPFILENISIYKSNRQGFGEPAAQALSECCPFLTSLTNYIFPLGFSILLLAPSTESEKCPRATDAKISE